MRGNKKRLSYRLGEVKMETVVKNETAQRVVNLYRASSKQQTEKKNNEGITEYDVPLQRDILRPFVERQPNWTLVKEFVEGGVSGFKVSANDRDALVEIKRMAVRKEFDILVIYMSDRLGRIADETPLVVSFLNGHNIRVISYTEGEIKANTHADKLMTYIRYWQAEGESLKTSARVSDAIKSSVEHGRWRGGNIAYGYRSVSRGTLNFKGKPILDIEIDEEQAEIVRKIFELSRVNNYGIRRIARYLNDNRIPAQKGGLWGGTAIRQLINNRIYCGQYVLRGAGKYDEPVISPVMENFVIISEKEWEEAQIKLSGRTTRERGAVRNSSHGKMLLSGLAYCGTCGAKITTLAQKSKYIKKDGERIYHKIYKYICGTFYHPLSKTCEGQTTFSAKKLDRTVVEDAKAYIRTINRNELIGAFYEKTEREIETLKAELPKKNAAVTKTENELTKLKEEIVRALMGTSVFPEATIKELLVKKEAEIAVLRQEIEDTVKGIADKQAKKAAYFELDETLANWSERFDAQDFDGQRIMLSNVIERINVFGDSVEIIYNIHLRAYNSGIKQIAVENIGNIDMQCTASAV
jgi:DNA invertase Pin-like site-specific DNA recombinase